ncbi:hypothetical protein AB0M64_09960 [Streptomyces sp. NPDC051771]|uniref:hypothetical protein n=1 Tax=Streptomyces sp. NPDC051771 TaxID=3154847 RepID=UPI0034333F1F
MNGWTAYGAMAVGAVMLGVYLAGVLAIPYSIFAVLAGTALVVDGGRRIIALRRHRHPPGS